MQPVLPIKILGSCATRDALEFSFAERLKLEDYLARTSLASLACGPRIDTPVLDQIASPFQRRMVQFDMSKEFWTILPTGSARVLLVDLVDDRFRLRRFQNGAAHTISGEYVKAKRYWTLNPSETLDYRHPAYDELWRMGLERLYHELAKTPDFQVLINCVHFIPTAETGINGPAETAEMNEYLESRYSLFAECFGEEALIKYHPGLLATDPDHKWGVAPYHYVPAVYRYLVDAVLSRCTTLPTFTGSTP